MGYNQVFKAKTLPEESRITENFASVDFSDSYMILKQTDSSVENLTGQILTLPNWIKIALKIRYYLIVKPFGLSTGKYDDKVRRLDLVPIILKSENEYVLGSDDSHLNYRISVLKDKDRSRIYLNTVVHFNNIGGRLYFGLVRIGHILVVKSLLSKIR